MDIEAWSGPFERAIELEDELHGMALEGYHCIIYLGACLFYRFTILPSYLFGCLLLQAVSWIGTARSFRCLMILDTLWSSLLGQAWKQEVNRTTKWPFLCTSPIATDQPGHGQTTDIRSAKALFWCPSPAART
jgi:hypothetical protein